MSTPPTRAGMERLSGALGGRFAYGADYNPEQWPEETWTDDVALMREAGVTMVSLGIFSWSLLEPEPGRYEFGWLDRIVDLLHEGGIAVDLATATASPPPWFARMHPEAALVDEFGVARSFGARQAWCPSSPVYRETADALLTRLADRYADHPAVVMWHVNNELGCHNWHCYCETSAAAFRAWLQERYTSLDALNDAWGTRFWSQRYGDWEEIAPPRAVAYKTFANPGQQLDWWRFSSDALRDALRAEAAIIRARASQPVTTNFMGFFKPADYRTWVGEQDLVSNDHYMLHDDPDPVRHLAMTGDMMRGLSGGAPWLLMEHSTSAVNWQPRNLAKAPGEMRRHSLAHVARGSDGVMFFQWRASRSGAEKYHSGMVAHAGTNTARWREVVALGADLERLAEIVGTEVEQPQVGLVLDWPSWWAATLDSHPSVDVDPMADARHWYDQLWQRNVTCDVVGTGDDLDRYRVLVLPNAYLLDDDAVERLSAWVEAGGVLVADFFSGIVDAADRVRLGGYPGALRDLLGVRIEEFFPLPEHETVVVEGYGEATVWSEHGAAAGATVLGSYATGPCAGSPAVTRNAVGDGSAWYVGTRLGAEATGDVLDGLLAEAGVVPTVAGLPVGVEVVRRRGRGGSYLFLLNHTDAEVAVSVDGDDLLGDAAHGVVAAGGVAVFREGGTAASMERNR